jgi:hypothetical protein
VHTLKFQARGTFFRPSAMALPFVESFEPGSIATFGSNRGTVVPYGSAMYLIPEFAHSDRDSNLTVALNHLHSLVPAFRDAGASEFILHIHRIFASRCNEEFTRGELHLLASLDCHLFYQARGSDESET